MNNKTLELISRTMVFLTIISWLNRIEPSPVWHIIVSSSFVLFWQIFSDLEKDK